MNRFKQLLAEFPLGHLILITVLLGLAPFPMKAQPHLVEKILMLVAGELSRPIDIFDLLMHSAPLILLILKLSWAKKAST